MPGGGVLEIETSNIIIDRKYVTEHPEAKVGTYVSISVIDTGMGIPEKNLNRVFEPFFTTKEASLGTGLGLSMVYGFLKQSGGHVAIESELGQGTRVSLFFPSSKSKQQRVDGESPKKTAFSSALQ
jgi:signal transduction histidine kinase